MDEFFSIKMMMMMMKILINENCRIIFIYVEKETNERSNIIAKSFAKETEKKERKKEISFKEQDIVQFVVVIFI